MPQPQTDAHDSLDKPRIDQFVALALAAPDEALLRRYFAECAGSQPEPSVSLTEAERRWVVVNLEANSGWQAAWRRLEEEAGRAVARPRQPLPPIPPRTPARAPHRRERRRGAVRTALTGAVALVGIYGVLWTTGRVMQPATYQMASVQGYEAVLREQARSAESDLGERAQGVNALLAAPRHTLGLFPRYDAEQAQRAATHLEEAFSATPDSFQRSEIAFFLAKAYLMQDDVPNARRWLEQGLAQQVADYREETIRLLETLPE